MLIFFLTLKIEIGASSDKIFGEIIVIFVD